MSGQAVLVTRPEPMAPPTIEALRRCGYHVAHEPLLVLRALSTPRPASVLSPAVVVTSGAVCHALAHRKTEVEDLFPCPCYCVGQRTAEALRAFGFFDLRRAAMDARALIEVFRRQESKGRPVLYITGQDREGTLERHLIQDGWSVSPWVVYRADPVKAFSESLRSLLAHGALGAALFYSRRTAQTFATLARAEGLAPLCAGIVAIGLSANVSEALEGLPFARLETARLPTEADMLTCLESHFPSKP